MNITGSQGLMPLRFLRLDVSRNNGRPQGQGGQWHECLRMLAHRRVDRVIEPFPLVCFAACEAKISRFGLGDLDVQFFQL